VWVKINKKRDVDASNAVFCSMNEIAYYFPTLPIRLCASVARRIDLVFKMDFAHACRALALAPRCQQMAHVV
jgi:hypothetical protein